MTIPSIVLNSVMKFIYKILEKAKGDVTVALSMGCDSLAVTHFIKTKYPKINLKCFHYNHNLRFQNATMQAAAISFCKEMKIPLSISVRDCLDHSDTSEASLRTLRYKAMAGMSYVITGHHLDDAVENYLYNCFNGVPEYLPIPLITQYQDFDLTIIRPFIFSEKQEMYEYVNSNSLQEFLVEDDTNASDNFRRNWLRNNLIPQIHDKGYNLKTIVKKRYNKWMLENLK